MTEEARDRARKRKAAKGRENRRWKAMNGPVTITYKEDKPPTL
jgi:hypothetical protein